VYVSSAGGSTAAARPATRAHELSALRLSERHLAAAVKTGLLLRVGDGISSCPRQPRKPPVGWLHSRSRSPSAKAAKPSVRRGASPCRCSNSSIVGA
jgi:hypothetical protein